VFKETKKLLGEVWELEWSCPAKDVWEDLTLIGKCTIGIPCIIAVYILACILFPLCVLGAICEDITAELCKRYPKLASKLNTDVDLIDKVINIFFK
jgi:hypothetical protein